MKALVLLLLTALILCSAPAAAQEADLELVATGVYDLDGSVTLTIAVSNAGPDEVMDVDITAQFDTALATASDLPTGCTGSSIGVVCSFSEIDTAVVGVGDDLIVEFALTPEEAAGEVAVNVRSSVSDPDDSNNSDSFPLIAATTVDVGLEGRGIDAGERKTLVFTARNAGPDAANQVRVMGNVTIDYDEELDGAAVAAITGMDSDEGAICGRQVPDSDGAFDRWTLPVSCSFSEMQGGDEVEFLFWFERSSNAQFRLTATSANLDTDHDNDVIDGDFRNSPIEVIDPPADEGCCAVISSRPRSGLLAAVLCVWVGRRRWRKRGGVSS